VAAHGASERRACQVVGMSRSVKRYAAKPRDDSETIDALGKLAERLPRFQLASKTRFDPDFPFISSAGRVSKQE
jgi:hypothetical protein